RGNRAGALDAVEQRPCEERRSVGLEIGERVVAEGAEQVRRLILVIAVVLQLAAQLEAMLVTPAEPGDLVLQLGGEPAAARGEVRAAAEAEAAYARTAGLEGARDE